MSAKSSKPCTYGLNCYRLDCWYTHPSGWNPQSQKQGAKETIHPEKSRSGVTMPIEGTNPNASSGAVTDTRPREASRVGSRDSDICLNDEGVRSQAANRGESSDLGTNDGGAKRDVNKVKEGKAIASSEGKVVRPVTAGASMRYEHQIKKPSNYCKMFTGLGTKNDCRLGQTCPQEHVLKGRSIICLYHARDKKCPNPETCKKVHLGSEDLGRLSMGDLKKIGELLAAGAIKKAQSRKS